MIIDDNKLKGKVEKTLVETETQRGICSLFGQLCGFFCGFFGLKYKFKKRLG